MHNNGNDVTMKQKHYYGYGSVIEERVFSSELSSCAKGLVEFGRVLQSC
jgi:hypothetical protein